MAGTAGGSGYPHRFCCYQCRRNPARRKRGLGRAFDLTGRRRHSKVKGQGYRSDEYFQYEYVCQDCGYTGWSRHFLVKDKWKARFAQRSLIED